MAGLALDPLLSLSPWAGLPPTHTPTHPPIHTHTAYLPCVSLCQSLSDLSFGFGGFTLAPLSSASFPSVSFHLVDRCGATPYEHLHDYDYYYYYSYYYSLS